MRLSQPIRKSLAPGRASRRTRYGLWLVAVFCTECQLIVKRHPGAGNRHPTVPWSERRYQGD